jgi:hypothetical protein
MHLLFLCLLWNHASRSFDLRVQLSNYVVSQSRITRSWREMDGETSMIPFEGAHLDVQHPLVALECQRFLKIASITCAGDAMIPAKLHHLAQPKIGVFRLVQQL